MIQQMVGLQALSTLDLFLLLSDDMAALGSSGFVLKRQYQIAG